jgi:hypothetical protein
MDGELVTFGEQFSGQRGAAVNIVFGIQGQDS